MTTTTDTRFADIYEPVADQLRAAGYHVGLLNRSLLVERFDRRVSRNEVADALATMDVVPVGLTQYTDFVVVTLVRDAA